MRWITVERERERGREREKGERERKHVILNDLHEIN
jgi:hypothetical protein